MIPCEGTVVVRLLPDFIRVRKRAFKGVVMRGGTTVSEGQKVMFKESKEAKVGEDIYIPEQMIYATYD